MEQIVDYLTVRRVTWGDGDTYLVIPEFRVDEKKFKEGQKVTVTIKSQ